MECRTGDVSLTSLKEDKYVYSDEIVAYEERITPATSLTQVSNGMNVSSNATQNGPGESC